jgi:hypothetical protein
MSDEYSNPPIDSGADNPPAPFGKLTWPEVWTKAVTKPAPETYVDLVEQEPNHIQTAAIWVAISGLVTGIFGLFGQASGDQFMRTFSEYADIDPSILDAAPSFGGGIFSIPFSIIFALIGSFIGAGIIHFVAKLLGGEGDFAHFYYAVATYQFPLSIAIGLLSVIPIIGCLNIFISLYMLYLLIQTTRGIHNLDSGKAAIAALVVPIGLFLFVFCCLIVFGFIFAGIFSEGFSDVISNISGLVLPFIF